MEGMRSVPEAEHHPGSVSSHKGRRFAEMPGASLKHIWESKQKTKLSASLTTVNVSRKKAGPTSYQFPFPRRKTEVDSC